MFCSARILVVPMHISGKRLLLFETQVVKGGGLWYSLKDVKAGRVEPTHIVVDDSCSINPKTMKIALDGLKLENSVVVSTRWLSECIKHKRLQPTSTFELRRACCTSIPSLEEQSIKDPPSKRIKISDTRKDLSDSMSGEIPSLPGYEKSTCTPSSSGLSAASSGNKQIISELQKLADAFRSKGDTWRSHGYTKAISAIKRCGRVIGCYEDAVALDGVGHKIASKVWEIVETGSLRKVSEICDDEKTRALETFTKIWGVGPSTAESWFQQGCRTLRDVKDKIALTKHQQIGLKYYVDFQDKIPKNEVELIGKLVSDAACCVTPLVSTTLVGSYRRGKDLCGDIDVMVCKPDHMISQDILSKIVSSLKETGLITDDLVHAETNGNQRKYLGVCRLPGENQKFRRIDIFVVPKSEWPTALMHYTGSALFNRSIRLQAARKGMCLSEHALYAGVVREGMSVLNEGHVIPTPTEESIFEALEVEFRAPEERDY